ncbi:unnamed protein product [Leuciscus chuanchicus]
MCLNVCVCPLSQAGSSLGHAGTQGHSSSRRGILPRNSRDTCNFDREFTKMAVELTPTDKLFIMNLDQDEFLGFSYTNPEYVIPTQG